MQIEIQKSKKVSRIKPGETYLLKIDESLYCFASIGRCLVRFYLDFFEDTDNLSFENHLNFFECQMFRSSLMPFIESKVSSGFSNYKDSNIAKLIYPKSSDDLDSEDGWTWYGGALIDSGLYGDAANYEELIDENLETWNSEELNKFEMSNLRHGSEMAERLYLTYKFGEICDPLKWRIFPQAYDKFSHLFPFCNVFSPERYFTDYITQIDETNFK